MPSKTSLRREKVSNVQFIFPPYFDSLRELMRHAEAMQGGIATHDQAISRLLYERDALQNFIGEAACVIREAEQRIRYLETAASEGV
jgi:hypothetical protein